MKTLDHNAIARATLNMGFRLNQRMDKKRHYDDDVRLAETMQHYQLDLKGNAQSGFWVEYTISFEEVIYYAPLQRTNKMEDPQFWWGAVFDSGRAMLTAHVKKWVLDASANYTGAIVEVGFQQTTYDQSVSPAGTPFQATIHVTFQGLSAPVEDPGYDETP
jgi:hypothetical protein